MKIQVNDKLSMELLCMDHAGELFHLTNKNREYLREWLPWLDSINSSLDTGVFITSMIDKFENHGSPNFAIIYNKSICGVTGFHKIDKQHNIGSIGYWLAQEHTGKGIATSTTQELLTIGFENYGLNKIEIHCAEGNTKSRAIPERLGFKFEATLRQCEWLYSKYVNHAIYSLLASEYNA